MTAWFLLKKKNRYSETNKIYFEIRLLSIMSNSYILKLLTASFYGKPFCGEKKKIDQGPQIQKVKSTSFSNRFDDRLFIK